MNLYWEARREREYQEKMEKDSVATEKANNIKGTVDLNKDGGEQ